MQVHFMGFLIAGAFIYNTSLRYVVRMWLKCCELDQYCNIALTYEPDVN